MNINPNQFQSAGELPVYQGGINTGTNWGENTGFSENNVEPQLPGIDFGNDGGNLRRRRKNEKENSLVPSPISLPSMAAAASAALALPKAQIDVLKGVGGFINKGASGALDMGKNFAGVAKREAGGGLEDLTIAAKNASGGVLGTLGKAAGSVGKGLGSAWDAIEPSGGFIGDIPENVVKGAKGAVSGLKSAYHWADTLGDPKDDHSNITPKDLASAAGRAVVEDVLPRTDGAPSWLGDQFKRTNPDGTAKTPFLVPVPVTPSIPVPGLPAPVIVPVP